jgi:hypothetical protein
MTAMKMFSRLLNNLARLGGKVTGKDSTTVGAFGARWRDTQHPAEVAPDFERSYG